MIDISLIGLISLLDNPVMQIRYRRHFSYYTSSYFYDAAQEPWRVSEWIGRRENTRMLGYLCLKTWAGQSIVLGQTSS